jgi:hypothetical protein
MGPNDQSKWLFRHSKLLFTSTMNVVVSPMLDLCYRLTAEHCVKPRDFDRVLCHCRVVAT